MPSIRSKRGPVHIIRGDACFAYFNKIWGIPQGQEGEPLPLADDSGTIDGSVRSDRMSNYAPNQREGLAGALAIHLCLYCGLGACFGFGLYELLQPVRISNPGLAAYKAPPRVLATSSAPPREVLTYSTTPLTTLSPSPPATRAATAAALPTSESEATGATVEPEVRVRPSPRSKGRTARASRPDPREAKWSRSGQAQRVACLPRYDSSGAQTSGC